MIIGYDPITSNFIDSNNNNFPIERMVKAIIVEDEKDVSETIEKTGDYFCILNRQEWKESVTEYENIFGDLRVGEVFLPKHSAVFNFLDQNTEFKNKPPKSTKPQRINTIY